MVHAVSHICCTWTLESTILDQGQGVKARRGRGYRCTLLLQILCCYHYHKYQWFRNWPVQIGLPVSPQLVPHLAKPWRHLCRRNFSLFPSLKKTVPQYARKELCWLLESDTFPKAAAMQRQRKWMYPLFFHMDDIQFFIKSCKNHNNWQQRYRNVVGGRKGCVFFLT